MPRAKVETRDVNVPEGRTIETGIEDEFELAVVTDEDMDKPHVKEYARDLAFNEDKITFTIGMDNNPNAEDPVPCGVNGEYKYLKRGVKHTLPRKFVDSLIKTTQTVKPETYEDANGLKQTRLKTKFTAVYPISIHHDPAGEVGVRWFEHQMANSF